MTKPNNLYYAYTLNTHATDYSLKGPIPDFLANRVKDHLLSAFNQTDFSVEGAQRSLGLSVESLRVLEIFSSLQKSTRVGSSVSALITTFTNKISKQTVSSADRFSYFSQYLDEQDLNSPTLNYYILQIIKHTNDFESVTKDQLVGLRNFFVHQAILSNSVEQLVYALRGISLIAKDIPAVRVSSDSKRTVKISDSKKSVTFELVDTYGKAFADGKSIKVSLADLSDGKAGLKEVTSQVKISKDKATWSLGDLPIGRYQLIFSVDSFTVAAPSVTVTDEIAIKSV